MEKWGIDWINGAEAWEDENGGHSTSGGWSVHFSGSSEFMTECMPRRGFTKVLTLISHRGGV